MQMSGSSIAQPLRPSERRGTQAEVTPRLGRDLLRATDAYAVDSRGRSWLHLSVTLTLLGASLALAALAPWWPLQLVGSLLSALVFVRAFILFHDFMHGAILRGSKLAEVIFFGLGMVLMTPPNAWRYGHNYHHKHVGKRSESSTGSFPILTTEMWRQSTSGQKLFYRIARHPLTILFAFFTVFAYSICFTNFRRSPSKYWDSLPALAFHVIGAPLIAWFGGAQLFLFVYVIPLLAASALGAYLFYAQHNFVGMQVPSEDEWEYHDASVATSSYLETGALMRFFTGNIGFHHVHHLAPRIPNYRLEACHGAHPAFAEARTLTWREGLEASRYALWDSDAGRMVTFAAAAARARNQT
jgi:omega-6 fatty acid desaturase (delta-12 desaturase)